MMDSASSLNAGGDMLLATGGSLIAVMESVAVAELLSCALAVTVYVNEAAPENPESPVTPTVQTPPPVQEAARSDERRVG